MNTQENEQPEWSEALASAVDALVSTIEMVAAKPAMKPKPKQTEPQKSNGELIADQIIGETNRLTGKPAQQIEPTPADQPDDVSNIINAINQGTKKIIESKTK